MTTPELVAKRKIHVLVTAIEDEDEAPKPCSTPAGAPPPDSGKSGKPRASVPFANATKKRGSANGGPTHWSCRSLRPDQPCGNCSGSGRRPTFCRWTL